MRVIRRKVKRIRGLRQRSLHGKGLGYFVFFVLGTCFANWYLKKWDISPFSINELYMQRIQKISTCEFSAFFEVLRERLGVLLIIFLAGLFSRGDVLLKILLSYVSAALGVVSTVYTIGFGIKGIILFFFTILPQGLVHLFLIYYCIRLAYDSKDNKNCGFLQEDGKRVFGILVIVSGLYTLGVLLEVIIQPFLMRISLEILN